MPRSRSTTPQVARERWTAAEAGAALKELAASGLSVSAFALREGIDAQRIYRWRQRLVSTAAPPPAFVEVTRRTAQPIEIVLRSGRVLRVSESVDGVALRRLVDVLEDERAC